VPIRQPNWSVSSGAAATQPGGSAYCGSRSGGSESSRLSTLNLVGEDHEDGGGVVLTDRSGVLTGRYEEEADMYFLLAPEPESKPQPNARTRPWTGPGGGMGGMGPAPGLGGRGDGFGLPATQPQAAPACQPN